MRVIPLSLGFFVVAALVFALQLIPIIGIFLMVMLAMFWSALLINAGMIGTVVEALSGRVSRGWLILPATFYCGYFVFAAADHLVLRQLRADYDLANAKVAIPFDPDRQSLVFWGDGGNPGAWYVQNYRLPVVYSGSPNDPAALRANRIIRQDVCASVRNAAFSAAGIYTMGIQDGDDLRSQRLDKRFCALGMPERPTLPLVSVATREDKLVSVMLPMTRVVSTVTIPDGRHYQLLGGVAAPLSWLPMPVMGCGLNSGAAKWQCAAGFMRDTYTPIVAGTSRYHRDATTLARALGLKPVAIADRIGSDAAVVRVRIADVEDRELKRQLVAVDRMVADPIEKVDDGAVGVLANRPEILATNADALMAGLERAADADPKDFWKARESGRILAGLIARLPTDRLVRYGSRLIDLYHAHFDPEAVGGDKSYSHWLWESEPLLRRLGDLGPQALFVAVDQRASFPGVNGAGVEAMCRIGAAGRARSGPALLNRWASTTSFDREERRALFVAMRRVGIVPPAIIETDAERQRRERSNSLGGIIKHRGTPAEELLKDWGDVTPLSPARVCSPKEEQARREEQETGRRLSNLM